MTEDEKQKALKMKMLLDGIELIKSGYAGVDKNGTIKDRRTTQGLIACRENPSLNTPHPKPVEGELIEGTKEWFEARNK